MSDSQALLQLVQRQNAELDRLAGLGLYPRRDEDVPYEVLATELAATVDALQEERTRREEDASRHREHLKEAQERAAAHLAASDARQVAILDRLSRALEDVDRLRRDSIDLRDLPIEARDHITAIVASYRQPKHDVVESPVTQAPPRRTRHGNRKKKKKKVTTILQPTQPHRRPVVVVVKSTKAQDDNIAGEQTEVVPGRRKKRGDGIYLHRGYATSRRDPVPSDTSV